MNGRVLDNEVITSILSASREQEAMLKHQGMKRRILTIVVTGLVAASADTWAQVDRDRLDRIVPQMARFVEEGRIAGAGKRRAS